MQRYIVIEGQDGVMLYLIVRKESVRHFEFLFAQQKEVFSFWRRRPAAVNWWRVLASPKDDDLPATNVLNQIGKQGGLPGVCFPKILDEFDNRRGRRRHSLYGMNEGSEFIVERVLLLLNIKRRIAWADIR